jgi:hypothetical protein
MSCDNPPTIVDQLLPYLGLDPATLSPQDFAVLNAAAETMLAQLRGYTGRYLTPATWMDTYTITPRSSKVILSEYPVSSIASIVQNGVVIPPEYYSVARATGMLSWYFGGIWYWDCWKWGGSYGFWNGASYCYGACYPTLTIQYNAGYDPMPADLLMLIADFCRTRFNDARNFAQSVQAGGSVVLGAVKGVQIEGVGRVNYGTSGGGGIVEGFSADAAAEGGPILGAGVYVAALYRDLQKSIYPDRHVLVDKVEPVPVLT